MRARLTKAQHDQQTANLALALKALERCRELLIIADTDADDLAEYDAATQALRYSLEDRSPTGARTAQSVLSRIQLGGEMGSS